MPVRKTTQTFGDVVYVRFYAENGVYAQTYHHEGCHILAHMQGTIRKLPWEAGSLNRDLCLFCTRARTREWLCPTCEQKGERTLLKPMGQPGSRRAKLVCPTCAFEIHRHEPEKEKTKR